jgi:hypothetical protein
MDIVRYQEDIILKGLKPQKVCLLLGARRVGKSKQLSRRPIILSSRT